MNDEPTPNDDGDFALNVEALWNALKPDEQEEACSLIWTTRYFPGGPPRLAHLEERLAGSLNYRIKTFRNLSPAKKGQHFAKRIRRPDYREYWDDAIRAWLLESRLPLICAFLDGAGIPHKEGLINSGFDEAPSAETLAAAIAAIDRFPDRDRGVYLGFHLIFGGEFWTHLVDAVNQAQPNLSGWLASAGSETDPEREDAAEPVFAENEKFTQLDNSLIRTVVAAAFGEDGALSEEQVRDLVEEVVELNTTRHRSLFHRGFRHALFGRELHFHFPGENEDRRHWYFCGVLFGLLRQGDPARCLKLIASQSELTRSLMQSSTVPCGAMLLPQLYRPLFEDGQYSFLADWLEDQINQVPWSVRINLLIGCHEDAANLLRKGEVAEAFLFLNVVDAALRHGSRRDLPTDFVQHIGPRNLRKIGQARQIQGDFEGAREILEKVIEMNLGRVEQANALVDLGLIKGPFRSIAGTLPKKAEDSRVPLVNALKNGRPEFLSAVERFSADAVNGHFVLGMLGLLDEESDPTASSDHFQQALNGMLKRESSYSEAGLIDWARFGLAVSLLETLDEADFRRAMQNLGKAAESPVDFPLWLWRRAFVAASAFRSSDESLLKAAQMLLRTSNREAISILTESGLASQSLELRAACIEWVRQESLSASDRWDACWRYLDGALTTGHQEQAGDCLDLLEELAVEHDAFRNRFLDLLSNDPRITGILAPEDIRFACIRMHELRGEMEQARALLQTEFYRLKDQGSDQFHNLCGIIERFESDGGLPEDLNALRNLMPAQEAEDETARSRLENGEAVKVLYIGGNEKQEAYETALTEELKAAYQGLAVDFYFPGWSSSWNRHLEKVLPKIGHVDAVVLNRMVRTQFGRHVRSHCGDTDRLWLACTGTGKGSLKNSIVAAALMALGRR